ncbi:MAG: MFS transporter [Candidatus Lokiarchaeota archaeon]|nr:MFS transporter [Candidatus Lokiarchaeota archaeon]
MNEKTFSKFLRRQIFFIGLLYLGDYLFFFFEQNFFNTYLYDVLFLPELYISLMVSLSAAMGLIIMIVWGIISDNTRTRFGRRRPYLLFGGTIAGIAMIFFGFSGNYILCLIIDVVIIGIASNAFLVAERSLIPDTFEVEKRGRANGIVNSISYIGLIVGVAFFMLGSQIFGVNDPRDINNIIISQQGHIFIFFIGGFVFLSVGTLGFTFIRERPISEFPEKKRFLDEIRQTFNLKELKSQKEFFKILLALVIFQSGIGSIMPFLMIFIQRQGLEIWQLLLGIGVAFPVVFVATISLGKLSDQFGRKKYIPLVIILISIGFSIMPFALGNFILFMIGLPFVLVGLLSMMTPFNAWSQDLLPEEKRGKFTGILNIVNTASQIIGSIAGGIVATLFGIQWIFLLGPFFFIGSIPIFMKVKETLKLEY